MPRKRIHSLFPSLGALLLMGILIFPYSPAQAQESAAGVTATPLTEDGIPADSISAANPPAIPSTPQSGLPLRPAVSPVDIDREKPEQPVMHYYDKHGNPLETPVRFLTELDTVVNVRPGPAYRAFNGISIGANIFDAIMMIAGQRRASFDIAADCSIHNWFFPVAEAGVGYADAKPDDGRCHYKSSPSFYAKIGMNYNFLYKSNPDYQVFLGLRVAMASFGYDIYDIAPGSQYDYEDGPASMTGLHATCFYGQVLGGLKVKIYRNFSMGWTFRYAFDIHHKFSDSLYPAWFIPGKGTGPISAGFSLIWSFGSRPANKTD
ncbi:MAG: hypothetical protein K2H35_06685 [Muribaculaceae bacterium]|nr:hypothetical protein [Muribaculaceae bacterium]